MSLSAVSALCKLEYLAHPLVGLCGVLERRKNMRIRSMLDAIHKRRDLGEERVVVGVLVALFVIVSWPTIAVASARVDVIEFRTHRT